MAQGDIEWIKTSLDRIEKRLDALPCATRGEDIAAIKERVDNHLAASPTGWGKSAVVIPAIMAFLGVAAAIIIAIVK